MKKILSNKKGQVSETITWIVATLIIVFLLVAGIYSSSLLGKTKSVSSEKIKSDSSGDWVDLKISLAKGRVDSENENEINDFLGGFGDEKSNEE